MKFKAGDRVRVIGSRFYPQHIGTEATVVSFWVEFGEYVIVVDGHPAPNLGGTWSTLPCHIAPILPLGSWSFIEKMLKTDIRKLRETV